MQHSDLDATSLARTLAALPASCQGLLALLPEAEKGRLAELQAACRKAGKQLAGAIFPALVDGTRFVKQGAWLLPFAAMPPHFIVAGLRSGDAVGRIVAAVRDGLSRLPAGSERPTLFLFFDGMLPNIASLLDGIYLELANRVEYAGVNAGSETFQAMPCLFDGEQLLGDGVLGLLLPAALSPVLEHGFVQPERAMSATSTDGNRIAAIDWQPAFDVYQRIVRDEYGVDLTRDNFYQLAVHFPFGIQRASGEVVVRIPVALADDGSLFCVGEVPENAMLVLLKAPARNANDCIGRLAARLGAEQGAMRGDGLLAFYCAGRRMHLGADAEGELRDLQAATGTRTLAGALSLGEIGATRRQGYPMFHNATLVCTTWPES